MNSGTSHAILLVGGRGTRLQPLTDTRPKSILPIAGLPFLEYQLAHLKRHGIERVTFACGFMPQEIVSHFGDGERLDMQLQYVVEPQPLDTAGAIAFAARAADPKGRVLVGNGDILGGLDVTALLDHHQRMGARATIALTYKDDPSRFGLVRTDAEHRITAFVEKPPPEEIDTNWVNGGTYVLEQDVIDMIPYGERVNIERQVFPSLVGDGLYAYTDSEYWNDIGTFASFLRANLDVLGGKVVQPALPVELEQRPGGVRIARSAMVDADARISGPVWIGPNARIGAGAQVGPGAVISESCAIREGGRVVGSVLLERVTVGREAQVVDSTIGEGAVIEPGCSVSDGAVVAPGARVEQPVLRG